MKRVLLSMVAMCLLAIAAGCASPDRPIVTGMGKRVSEERVIAASAAQVFFSARNILLDEGFLLQESDFASGFILAECQGGYARNWATPRSDSSVLICQVAICPSPRDGKTHIRASWIERNKKRRLVSSSKEITPVATQQLKDFFFSRLVADLSRPSVRIELPKGD